MRPTVRAALRGLAAFACAVGVGVADVAAAPLGAEAPLLARYQDAPNRPGPWDGEASVTVEIGPRTTVNEITLDGSGNSETAIAADGTDNDADSGQFSVAAYPDERGVAELAIDHAVNAPRAVNQAVTLGASAEEPLSATDPTPPESDQVADGIAVGGIATGGQTGASVLIGDTRGGPGEPGAPGGDAHVAVEIGPITGGLAVAGDATGGEGIAFDQSDPLSGATNGLLTDAGSARLGSLITLPAEDGRLGPAVGGAAIGGSAQGGDATVDIVIGDTIGGAGGHGHAGGNAEVIIEIGPITGGQAAGGAAAGGDAIQGTGTAIGGAAAGGAARGGDARVVIAIGNTIGVDGHGGAGDAAVIIAIGAMTGGNAIGGTATGGEAWGLAGIDAGGGRAAGGDAAGGGAVVELRIDKASGGRYEANVGAIVGGDATGGGAVGGDAIDGDAIDGEFAE